LRRDLSAKNTEKAQIQAKNRENPEKCQKEEKVQKTA